MPLTVALHPNHAPHQQELLALMAAGIRAHGHHAVTAPPDEPVACDAAVIWGWRQMRVVKAVGQYRVIVMERGCLPDRMTFTSIGVGGLAGRGLYARRRDSGERFGRIWGGMMQDWRRQSGPALLCGQCAGDASLRGIDHRGWLQQTADALRMIGHDVIYRPHPEMVKRGIHWTIEGARTEFRPLRDALGAAGFAVTYNSTVGVDAAMAGCPVVVQDYGSMARPVAAWTLTAAGITPDRDSWAHDLAWTMFTRRELQTGFAWECISEVLDDATEQGRRRTA